MVTTEALRAEQFMPLLHEAERLWQGTPQEPAVRDARARAQSRDWTVLLAGPCSVGKSSLAGVLWGDPTLTPTAVRDCTQTNTQLRVPDSGESTDRLRLHFLSREQALQFALRDLSYYRLHDFLKETQGPFGVALDEGLPEERIRKAVRGVREVFAKRADLCVLHEHLTDELTKLEELLDFLDGPVFRPGASLEAAWDERREWLMGRRGPDGRAFDLGKLLALRQVELLRAPGPRAGWAQGAPRLMDTPWVPTFHHARRAELIIEQARQADIVLLLALPQAFSPEPWAEELLRAQPEQAARTLVVFNQIDTVDAARLFSREGFRAEFEASQQAWARLRIPSENTLFTCARLPFLELQTGAEQAVQRAEKLRRVLASLRRASEGRPESLFLRLLRQACDPEDAGVRSLRTRLESLRQGVVAQARMRGAWEGLAALELKELPAERRPAWSDLLGRLRGLR